MEVFLQWMDELDDLFGSLALGWHRIMDMCLGLTTALAVGLTLFLCIYLIL